MSVLEIALGVAVGLWLKQAVDLIGYAIACLWAQR